MHAITWLDRFDQASLSALMRVAGQVPLFDRLINPISRLD